MTSQLVYDIAVANDDPHPDDVCPGCGADITGWRGWPAHHPRGGFASDQSFNICSWRRDYLVARVFRRAWISEGVTR